LNTGLCTRESGAPAPRADAEIGTDAKDENVSRFFSGSPKHRDEHVVTPCNRLNYRRALFANFLPKLIKRGPIT